ncbi:MULTISPECIES: phosphatase PAP2 family protein [Nocardiaceae]|uniref:phosphatase PAP2 family protein n=1 Tax=Nocardiaceae TaxID=85025 RepID=UPI000485B041|nr:MULTISPECIES: phosphatase PAP2 family protein [Rhodococcus]AMY52078.1 Lipid A 1-diphosphate synthase [Rhodococcus fascians D188]MDJ0470447.1 phosphatase PAP2 family protein [Rhodococcus fascians]MDQ0281848.1 undecaprenyl-diphosphatase [Rhodococcus fascians]
MGPDHAVLEWMVEHRVGWVTTMFWIITTVGNTFMMFVLSAGVWGALLTSKRTVDAWMVAGSMLTGWGLMNALKFAFARERPPIPERLVEISSHSFPSGHATMSMLLATVAIAVMLRSSTPWLHRPVLLTLPVVAALLIGFSRIYLGAHWTTDVLAGWVFGALWGLGWIYAEKAISARNPSAAR